jgi:hypothetical protein
MAQPWNGDSAFRASGRDRSYDEVQVRHERTLGVRRPVEARTDGTLNFEVAHLDVSGARPRVAATLEVLTLE